MEQKERFKGFAAVWKRVEEARAPLAGAAPLMPRKKKGFPIKAFPLYGKDEATSSASRG